MPTPIVMGMLIGSRPGRARRARAPMIRPSTARTIRNAIRLISLALPDPAEVVSAITGVQRRVAGAEQSGGVPGALDGAQPVEVGGREGARGARRVGQEVQERPARGMGGQRGV